MALYGKTTSAKRSKPSYALAIVGVALVLFLFGMVGWFFLNLKKSSEVFRENIQVHAYIAPAAKKNQIDSMQKFIAALPYVKSADYITKEKAEKVWNSGNDSGWKKIIAYNPLPESIDFYVKSDYMDRDSLIHLQTELENNFTGVMAEFQYPTQTVSSVTSYAKYIGAGVLAFTILLSIIVIISIDNTIRLAMYSNRFLIKTMQMVGATRGFITRPLDIRAIINGFISACIAIAAIYISILVIENFVPEIHQLRDGGNMAIIIISIILLGVIISLLSTHRSVLKYLRMKLDDLY